MRAPETYPKEIYLDLALGFKKAYEQNKREIETFEHIFLNKALTKKCRDSFKDLLKIIYKERDDNARNAKYYRALYNSPEGRKRVITWCKA
jgi:hypothetical protein